MEDGAWRSLVAHLLWEQGVGGSNPLAPTTSDLFARVPQLMAEIVSVGLEAVNATNIRACSSARIEQRPPKPWAARSNRARRTRNTRSRIYIERTW